MSAQAFKKFLDAVRKEGDFAVQSQKQLEDAINRDPDAVEAAFEAHKNRRKNNSTTPKDTGKPTTTTTAAKPKIPKNITKEFVMSSKFTQEMYNSMTKAQRAKVDDIVDKLSGQKDATDIGEAAARNLGKGKPDAPASKPKAPKPKTRRKRRKEKEPESISSIQRDATDIGEEAARRAMQGSGGRTQKQRRQSRTGTANKPPATKASKPPTTRASKNKQDQLPATTGNKPLARTGGSTTPAQRRKGVESSGRTLKERLSPAEKAVIGASLGMAAYKGAENMLDGEKPTPRNNDVVVQNGGGTKTKTRQGDIGRTNMGDFYTTAKVAPSPNKKKKKKPRRSGMGMAAYQKLTGTGMRRK